MSKWSGRWLKDSKDKNRHIDKATVMRSLLKEDGTTTKRISSDSNSNNPSKDSNHYSHSKDRA
nr:hypothetical protein [Candidatus Njordarchaeota archaeon]